MTLARSGPNSSPHLGSNDGGNEELVNFAGSSKLPHDDYQDEQVVNARVPQSSTLPVFDIIYDKLMGMKLSPYLDRELLGYIRPPLTQDQIKQALAQIQGEPCPRGLPEMTPLDSLEELGQPGTSGDKRVPEIDINAPPEPLGAIPVVEGSKKRSKTQEGTSTKRQKTEGSGDETTKELRSRKPSTVTEPATCGTKKKTGKKTLVIQDVVVRNVEQRTHQEDATEHSQSEDVQHAGDTTGAGEASIGDEGENIIPRVSIVTETSQGGSAATKEGRLEATLQVVAETTTITQKMHQLMESDIAERITTKSTPVPTDNQEENQERSLVAIGSPTRVASGSPIEKDSPTRFIYDLRDRREVMLKDLDRQLREHELEIREELRRKKDESPPVVIAEMHRMEAELVRLQ
ncbi:hypothetical protein R1sor_003039 [Riccia sorocarpa]|uniref:Uncharacterized protein n=1 Tax=Riccia sorocarpa TaxID=122646 RepID=A0ABD3H361_9MARC